MAKPSRGMDAVLAKVGNGKRKPAFKRKGDKKAPGIAIMIAVGKPKDGMRHEMGKNEASAEDANDKPVSRVAALEAKIAELEAKLAKLDAEHENMGACDDDAMEHESDDDESY